MEKVVYSDTGRKVISEKTVGQAHKERATSGTGSQSKAAQQVETNKGPSPTVELSDGPTQKSSDNTGASTFMHNIRTTIPVQVLAPNRLRILDDPKPPDGGGKPGQEDMMQDEGDDMQEEVNDSVDEDIMVEETPHT